MLQKKSKNPKIYVSQFLAFPAVFNIDNNKCDTEDWSNGCFSFAKFIFAITGIHLLNLF